MKAPDYIILESTMATAANEHTIEALDELAAIVQRIEDKKAN